VNDVQSTETVEYATKDVCLSDARESEDQGLAGSATACIDGQPVDADYVRRLRSARPDERKGPRHGGGATLDDRTMNPRLGARMLAACASGPNSTHSHREYRHGQENDPTIPTQSLHISSSSRN